MRDTTKKTERQSGLVLTRHLHRDQPIVINVVVDEHRAGVMADGVVVDLCLEFTSAPFYQRDPVTPIARQIHARGAAVSPWMEWKIETGKGPGLV